MFVCVMCVCVNAELRVNATGASGECCIEREILIDNLLNHGDDFSRSALRHGSLNSNIQVA